MGFYLTLWKLTSSPSGIETGLLINFASSSLQFKKDLEMENKIPYFL